MSGPCPPGATLPPPRVRRHASCNLCQVLDGDPVRVRTLDGKEHTFPLADLSPAGVTLHYGQDLGYIPWTSVLLITWEPVARPPLAPS